MSRPACFNRPERLPEGAGWKETGKVKFELTPGRYGFFKPIYRYRWPWFTDACKSWDAPRIEDSVPARERWDCSGCRWLPVKGAALLAERDLPVMLSAAMERIIGR